MFTIQELLDGYRKKKFSPVEITKSYIEKAKVTEEMNAFITITEERALHQAHIAEERWTCGEAGKLEGIPVSYKDNIFVKGFPATSGSQIDREFIPEQDAKSVKVLRQEGAVMIGKTNMHEFAFGITNDNPFYGPSRNPWNLKLISGGSSGGSAVSVALDSSMISIGTDTGGSIRIPASCCGLVGLKPTYQLIDHSGVSLISWNLDHSGPIARTVEDVSIVLEALTGDHYSFNEHEANIRGLKIGIPLHVFNDRMETEILQCYKDVLKKLEAIGAILVDVEIPHTEEMEDLAFTIATAEAGHVHKERAKKHLDKYGDDVRLVMEAAKNITALEYISALKRKEEIASALNNVFTEVDLIVTPTLPVLPKEIGKEMVNIQGDIEPLFNCMIRYTSYFNVTGHPALSIPAGLSKEKLPIGIQLIGRHFREKQLLKAAKAFEQQYLSAFYKERNQKMAKWDHARL